MWFRSKSWFHSFTLPKYFDFTDRNWCCLFYLLRCNHVYFQVNGWAYLTIKCKNNLNIYLSICLKTKLINMFLHILYFKEPCQARYMTILKIYSNFYNSRKNVCILWMVVVNQSGTQLFIWYTLFLFLSSIRERKPAIGKCVVSTMHGKIIY